MLPVDHGSRTARVDRICLLFAGALVAGACLLAISVHKLRGRPIGDAFGSGTGAAVVAAVLLILGSIVVLARRYRRADATGRRCFQFSLALLFGSPTLTAPCWT